MGLGLHTEECNLQVTTKHQDEIYQVDKGTECVSKASQAMNFSCVYMLYKFLSKTGVSSSTFRGAHATEMHVGDLFHTFPRLSHKIAPQVTQTQAQPTTQQTTTAAAQPTIVQTQQGAAILQAPQQQIPQQNILQVFIYLFRFITE